jgi:dephospho-CoA kinase
MLAKSAQAFAFNRFIETIHDKSDNQLLTIAVRSWQVYMNDTSSIARSFFVAAVEELIDHRGHDFVDVHQEIDARLLRHDLENNKQR